MVHFLLNFRRQKLLGVKVASYLSDSPVVTWAIFIFFSLLHVYANYRCVAQQRDLTRGRGVCCSCWGKVYNSAWPPGAVKVTLAATPAGCRHIYEYRTRDLAFVPKVRFALAPPVCLPAACLPACAWWFRWFRLLVDPPCMLCMCARMCCFPLLETEKVCVGAAP